MSHGPQSSETAGHMSAKRAQSCRGEGDRWTLVLSCPGQVLQSGLAEDTAGYGRQNRPLDGEKRVDPRNESLTPFLKKTCTFLPV